MATISLSSLENPALCDVTLVGTDGGRVNAIRSILSARSDVLERLLVGSFQEASTTEVQMAYPAAVIRAMVRSCCTDAMPDMDELGQEDYFEAARNAVKLCAAADYYELDVLREKTIGSLRQWLRTEDGAVPIGACAAIALDECMDMPSLEEVREMVLGSYSPLPQ